VVELDHGARVAGERTDRPGRVRPAERTLDLPEPAETAVLSAHGLRKVFHQGGRRIVAVSGASLALHRQELVALTGRSGSGKTTFLNLLSGWEEADGGTIRWADGRTVTRRAWRELAVLPQQLGLLDELTVRENVEYPIRLAPDIEVPGEAVVDLLERLGLDRLSHRYPPEVSLGEQQRTALARALVLSPLVVLADEPSGHQDAGWAGAVFDELRRSAIDGSACLAATHDAVGVRYADRVVHMDDGTFA
jgi:putative ABC transport system ATP-binding protein